MTLARFPNRAGPGAVWADGRRCGDASGIEELRNRGADYSKAARPFEAHVVEDKNLITGQNPASAQPLAKTVVAKPLVLHIGNSFQEGVTAI